VYEVQDGTRTFKFEGVLLALATSYRPGIKRWVEFSLYRTVGGHYVLSRIGETTLYHMTTCEVAHRNGLRATPAAALRQDSVPCDVCRPELDDPEEIMQEVPRYWAQVCDTPDAVVDSLHRYDESGSRYLTGVARRLLEEASELDPAIDEAYHTELIL
jgi:hypothetical protein